MIEWSIYLSDEKKQVLEEKIHLRKIRFRKVLDILRWGNKGEGTFTFNDVYLLAVGLTEA